MMTVMNKYPGQKRDADSSGVSEGRGEATASNFLKLTTQESLLLLSAQSKVGWNQCKWGDLPFGNLPIISCVCSTQQVFPLFPLKVGRLSALPSNVSAASASFHPGRDPWLWGLQVGLIKTMCIKDSSTSSTVIPNSRLLIVFCFFFLRQTHTQEVTDGVPRLASKTLTVSWGSTLWNCNKINPVFTDALLQSANKYNNNGPILRTFHTTAPLSQRGGQVNKTENKKTAKKMTFNKFMIVFGRQCFPIRSVFMRSSRSGR